MARENFKHEVDFALILFRLLIFITTFYVAGDVLGTTDMYIYLEFDNFQVQNFNSATEITRLYFFILGLGNFPLLALLASSTIYFFLLDYFFSSINISSSKRKLLKIVSCISPVIFYYPSLPSKENISIVMALTFILSFKGNLGITLSRAFLTFSSAYILILIRPTLLLFLTVVLSTNWLLLNFKPKTLVLIIVAGASVLSVLATSLVITDYLNSYILSIGNNFRNTGENNTDVQLDLRNIDIFTLIANPFFSSESYRVVLGSFWIIPFLHQLFIFIFLPMLLATNRQMQICKNTIIMSLTYVCILAATAAPYLLWNVGASLRFISPFMVSYMLLIMLFTSERPYLHARRV